MTATRRSIEGSIDIPGYPDIPQSRLAWASASQMYLHVMNEYVWSQPLDDIGKTALEVNPYALGWLCDSIEKAERDGFDVHIWACQIAVAMYVLCVCSMSPEMPVEQAGNMRRGYEGSIIIWKNSLSFYSYENLHWWFQSEISSWASSGDWMFRWYNARRIIEKVLWLLSDGSSLLKVILSLLERQQNSKGAQ